MAKFMEWLLFLQVVFAFGLEHVWSGAITLNGAGDVLDVREGCRAVLTCQVGISTPMIQWRKTGSDQIISAPQILSEMNGIRYNTVDIERVLIKDQGLYTCSDDNSQIGRRFLVVMEGKMVIGEISNSTGPARCHVKTCLPDVEIQFFRGTELLDSTTEPADKGWLGKLDLDGDRMVPGEYVCQARSERGNIVAREFFYRQ